MKATFLIIFSLLLIYVNDSLIIYSPSIIICLMFLLFTKDGIDLLFKPDVLLLLLIFIYVLSSSPFLESKELVRLLFVLGGIALANNLKRRQLYFKHLLYSMYLIFTLDLLLRILVADFNNISIYSLKAGGGIFSDSNFSAIMILSVIIVLLDYPESKKHLIITLIFLLLTFSRTTWIMLIFYFIIRKHKGLSILSLILFTLFPVLIISTDKDIWNFDGSMRTKILIFEVFFEIFKSDPLSLLTGLGRNPMLNNIEQSYAGHTIFGQIVQYGVLITSSFIYLFYRYSKNFSLHSLAFFSTILLGGIISLFPASYVGMIFIITGSLTWSRTHINYTNET